MGSGSERCRYDHSGRLPCPPGLLSTAVPDPPGLSNFRQRGHSPAGWDRTGISNTSGALPLLSCFQNIIHTTFAVIFPRGTPNLQETAIFTAAHQKNRPARGLLVSFKTIPNVGLRSIKLFCLELGIEKTPVAFFVRHLNKVHFFSLTLSLRVRPSSVFNYIRIYLICQGFSNEFIRYLKISPTCVG